FGAIDPVTRDRLQDEFLALQDQVKKTICFVTHDLDEAVKLGDRIAVFGQGGKLHQYDVPARVLSEPADDFVSEFVGGGAAVRRLALVTLDDMPLRDVLKSDKGRHSRGDLVAQVDGRGRPRAWHHVPGHTEEDVAMVTIGKDASLHAAVDEMLTQHVPVVAVVDDAGRLVGGLRWEDMVTEHTDQAISDAVAESSAAPTAEILGGGDA
ncbi:CBS domain-containing protein, partial [Actinotalea sp.]|uniref:CBS domain-containing protein n=1 Tax=Actinotalea sp. TaxID=1872145 RepID=UPI00356538AB